MNETVAHSRRPGAYTPQPGTIPARVIAYLRDQSAAGRQWVPAAELADHIGQPAVSPYLSIPMAHGALIRRAINGNRNVQEYALGDGTPQSKPADHEDDEPLKPISTTPTTSTIAGLWPGLATPPPDTRPAKVTGAEKAWASGAQKNHRGSTPEWGKHRGLPPLETMTTPKEKPMPKRKQTAPMQYADVDTMVITDDPITKQANTGGDKYSPLFDKMKVGQAVKCHPKDAPKVAGAMRKWVKDHRPGAMVRAVRRYPKDNMGRVWLLAPAKGK